MYVYTNVSNKMHFLVPLSVLQALYRGKLVRYNSGSTRDTASPDENDTHVPSGGERSNGDTDQMRRKVFEASLDYVPKYGWSRRAIAAGSSPH